MCWQIDSLKKADVRNGSGKLCILLDFTSIPAFMYCNMFFCMKTDVFRSCVANIGFVPVWWINVGKKKTLLIQVSVYLARKYQPGTRVATVRETSGENENFSRSGKSQKSGKIFDIVKVSEKSEFFLPVYSS